MLNYAYSVLIVCWPGGARRPLTFFASPKKVSKERRPRCHWPSASQLCEAKNGKASKLASLKQRSFLYPFSAPHNWQCQKWMKVKVKVKTKTKTKSKTKSKTKTMPINWRKQFERPLALYVLFFPHVQMPIVWLKNGKKWRRCLSRRRVSASPHFSVTQLGTRRAAAPASPSFAYFSWRSKKSEWLSGHPRPTDSIGNSESKATAIALELGIPSSSSQLARTKHPPSNLLLRQLPRKHLIPRHQTTINRQNHSRNHPRRIRR